MASPLRWVNIPDDQILAVITAAENLFLGAALDSAAPDVMITAGDDAAADLRRALDAAPSGPGRAKQAYELGVDLLIDGLRVKLARTQLPDSGAVG